MPKSRWNGTHDRLVNIPILEQDIYNTIKCLPRTPAEAGIISVDLKRKLEYKTTHLKQLIDVKKIYEYLRYLKNIAKNKYYQFYDDIDVYIERCEEDQEGLSLKHPESDETTEELDSCESKVIPDDEVIEHDSSDDEEDIEYRTNDAIRKHQFDYDMTTCMIPKYPEANPEHGNKEMKFAPGEGKIPTNILKEDDWDIKSFPNLHPTGNNGLHQKREIKGLTYQQYFEQRLKNKDTRFEKCTCICNNSIH